MYLCVYSQDPLDTDAFDALEDMEVTYSKGGTIVYDSCVCNRVYWNRPY